MRETLNESTHTFVLCVCIKGVTIICRLVGRHKIPRGVHPQCLHPSHRQEQALHLHRGKTTERVRYKNKREMLHFEADIQTLLLSLLSKH